MNYCKTYEELMTIPTFEDRVKYLQTHSVVGDDTFGFDRYLNQQMYLSYEWKRIRDYVIVRDNGCDLGMPDRPIFGRIYVHHITPLTKSDILSHSDAMFDLNNLICCSRETHDAIHYGFQAIQQEYTPREANDTCPWKK